MKNKVINLFGTKFTIKYVNTLIDEETGSFLYGRTDSIYNKVEISTKLPDGTSLPEEEIELTLWHELFHVIFFNGQYLHCYQDEPLVEWSAKCIKTLLKQLGYTKLNK